MTLARARMMFLAGAAAVGCGGSEPGTKAGQLSESTEAIVYGTADTTHTAVVSLLANTAGGYTECTGTVVQVANGNAYVLTAAHCCTPTAPTLVVTGTDYSVGLQYLAGGNPQPPTYAVLAGSVLADPAFTNNPSPQHDLCMLQFVAPAAMPVIPVALPGQDGLSLGVTVEHVGYGVTQTNQNNTVRETGSAPIDQNLSATDFQSTEGNGVAGSCQGDSGGPALLPAGSPQAQQRVVGVASFGDATCTQYDVDERVSAETGPGGFIYTYLGLGGADGGTDGGSGVDSGSVADSGVADSGSAEDAGSSFDAGRTPDAGGAAPDAGSQLTPNGKGCGCQQSDSAWVGMLGLLVALGGRRWRRLN